MSVYLDSIMKRRSVYGLSANSTLPDEKIGELIQTALRHTPSAFNSQSARAVLLLGTEHAALWGIVSSTLRAIVDPSRFAATQEKLNAFAAGHGTILFFEDQDVVAKMQKDFSFYAENFPLWSLQSSGMVQHVVWTALANEGLGASLQHYNPLIDDEVNRHWELPTSWKLISQMPFGTQTVPPDEKQFEPMEARFKSFGCQQSKLE